MKFRRDSPLKLDVRQGYGLELLQNAQLYKKKPPHQDDWVDELAFSMRPGLVRAIEWFIGPTKVITEKEILIASVRRVTVGDTTYYNQDIIAMTVEPEAVDKPTTDVRVFPYWDFQCMYRPTMPPEVPAS